MVRFETAMPGKQVSEQVRDHQQVGSGGVGGAGPFGHQLTDGVESHRLRARCIVKTPEADDLVELGQRTRCPLVPVMERWPEQPAVAIEKPIVDAPAIDTNPKGALIQVAMETPQPLQHPLVQTEQVPVDPVGQLDRPVGEPRHLFHHEAVVFEPTRRQPGARRAEVDGSVEAGGRQESRTSSGNSRHPPAPGLPHRRKAAATPASTGTIRPVVRARWPAVRTKTASATCSGRTSSLRSVREA